MSGTKDFEAKREKLIELVRKRSYKEGDFTLASGKKSTFYLDLKETTLSQEGMLLVGKLACDWMEREGLSFHAVGGMTMGADPIAVAIAYEAGLRGIPLESYIVRKEPKGHGTGQWLEGTNRFPKGAKLLVVEDVVTTGGSSLKAIQAIRAAGFEVAALLTVCDREEGGRAVFEREGVKYFSLSLLREVRAKNIN